VFTFIPHQLLLFRNKEKNGDIAKFNSHEIFYIDLDSEISFPNSKYSLTDNAVLVITKSQTLLFVITQKFGKLPPYYHKLI